MIFFRSKIVFLLTLFTTLCIAGLTEVIIYSSPDDKKKNRGFCFLEYESHKVRVLDYFIRIASNDSYQLLIIGIMLNLWGSANPIVCRIRFRAMLWIRIWPDRHHFGGSGGGSVSVSISTEWKAKLENLWINYCPIYWKLWHLWRWRER